MSAWFNNRGIYLYSLYIYIYIYGYNIIGTICVTCVGETEKKIIKVTRLGDSCKYRTRWDAICCDPDNDAMFLRIIYFISKTHRGGPNKVQ